MAYGNKYILPFTSDLGEVYEIYFDFLNFIPILPITLLGTSDCLTLRNTSGDQNKLQPILGTECLIKINVEKDQKITIADLIAQHDNDIRITVFKDRDYTKSIFQGFVVVQDNFQPLQDPPYILSIRALDGLGLLKGVDLVDTNGVPFTGSLSIIQWIAQILYKTGQTLNIRTYFNFYNSSFSESASALVETQLNANTFKKAESPETNDPSIDINALNEDDCYTALEKIVRCFRCRLFQEDGVWNLVSLYEYLNPNGYNFYEFQVLAPVSGIVQVSTVAIGNDLTYDIPIGKNEIIHPVSKDANLYLVLAYKWIKLTYNYDQSQNKLCNQDFQNSLRDTTHDEVISSTIIDPLITPVVNLQTWGYDHYCWNNNDGPFSTLPAPSNPAFVRSVLDVLGYETQRFAVIPTNPTTVGLLINTNNILIDSGDRIEITLEWRMRTFIPSATTIGVVYILLTGADGSFWFLFSSTSDIGEATGGTTQWVATDSVFSTALPMQFVGADHNTWQTISAGAVTAMADQKPGIKTPISGSIKFVLSGQNVGSGNEAWFKNINITLHPYLNGTYRELNGDYNFSSSVNNIKQTDDENVEISDSPKRYFKGALLNIDGVSLSPPNWHRKGISESFRFTQGMEQVMYTHMTRIMQKVEGNFRGLTYIDNKDITIIRQAGLINSYYFTDSETPDKKYMLTSFEKNYCTGQGRNLFIETRKDINDTGFAVPDTYVFNYIFK